MAGNQKAFIVATKQVWQLGLLAIVLAIALVFAYLTIASGLQSHWLVPSLVVGAIVVAVVVTAVRCPKCHARLLLDSWGRQGAGQWLGWLFSFRSCPKCGYTPEERSDAM